MPDLTLEQLLAESSPDRPQVQARSAGVREEWLPELLRILSAFGEPPPGQFLTGCVFAQPFGKKFVSVVSVATDPQSGKLQYHALILSAPLYSALGDPFSIAERYPAPWGHVGELPTLEWQDGPLPPRTVSQISRILQESDSPALLGSAQALIDGCRVAFVRPFPAPDLIRRLWLLLPTSTRAELWPASYVFSRELDLHAVAVPSMEVAPANAISEQQAGDYPEGRYEFALQAAAESEDQESLDRLLARRSSREVMRLAMLILVAMIVMVLLSQLLEP